MRRKPRPMPRGFWRGYTLAPTGCAVWGGMQNRKPFFRKALKLAEGLFNEDDLRLVPLLATNGRWQFSKPTLTRPSQTADHARQPGKTATKARSSLKLRCPLV